MAPGSLHPSQVPSFLLPIHLRPHFSACISLGYNSFLILGSHLKFVRADPPLQAAVLTTKCHHALQPTEVGSTGEGLLNE